MRVVCHSRSAAAVKQAVDNAFMDGFRVASWAAAAVALVGAALAYRFLPAHADEHHGASSVHLAPAEDTPALHTV